MDIVEYKNIVAALRPRLLLVAKNITGCKEDAEDIVQEVCLRLWHSRNNAAHLNNVEAYCTTMAKHLSIDKIRSRKLSVSDVEIIHYSDGQLLPDELLEEKETSVVIRKIIGLLPSMQQQVVRMKELEGIDNEEIAKALDTNVESVRNNLSRARKKIKELYAIYHNNVTMEV